MKKILTILLIVLGATYVQAAYLYWQVSSPQTSTDSRTINFDYATVWARNGNQVTQLYIADSDGQTSTAQYAPQGTENAVAINLDQLGDPTSYAFFIELVTYNNNNFSRVGISEDLGWASGVEQNYIDANGVFNPLPAAEAWHGSGYSVPEPTSALLVLLGIAGLGLRRRKA